MDINPKSNRVLELYTMLLRGETINRQEIAEQYGVTVRSVQRDIDTIREFLAEQNVKQGRINEIVYSRKNGGYRLEMREASYLRNGEVFAIAKILIESRAFPKEKLESLMQRILTLCVPQAERDAIEILLANELFHYASPAHVAVDCNTLWDIADAVKNQKKIQISYQRVVDKQLVKRTVEPVGVLFSEFYFYLLAYNPEKKQNFTNKEDTYPTIYRIDRLQSMVVTNERFNVEYTERFHEGDYKNKVQYMYGGTMQTIKFRYSGPSIEAVLDKLPSAKISEEKDGSFLVTAEVFGTGIVMWLLSQGNKVQVEGPEVLKEKIKNEISQMSELYK